MVMPWALWLMVGRAAGPVHQRPFCPHATLPLVLGYPAPKGVAGPAARAWRTRCAGVGVVDSKNQALDVLRSASAVRENDHTKTEKPGSAGLTRELGRELPHTHRSACQASSCCASAGTRGGSHKDMELGILHLHARNLFYAKLPISGSTGTPLLRTLHALPWIEAEKEDMLTFKTVGHMTCEKQ